MAGLALTIVATTDLCFKYGRILVKTCAAIKGAELEINERVLSVESYWKRTTLQLKFIERIWNELDRELQTIQTQILQVLISKLSNIISKLENLSRRKSGNRETEHQVTEVKRWKYVLMKQCLDESIEDLASWQKMFDPSWFLILRVSSPLIDQELGHAGPAISTFTSINKLRDALREQPLLKIPIFLPDDGVEMAQMREIPFASAKRVPRVGSDTWVVIDSSPCAPEIDIELVTKDVRDLARKLSSVDPFVFGILQCRGVIRIKERGNKRPSSFDFVFNIPRGLNNEPKSLRCYLSSGLELTLNDRLEVGKTLAKSIGYIHTVGFVHKNVRPETVLGFQNNNAVSDSFFLIGFGNIRTADGRTLQLGDSTWEKNLYRHPQRQGLNPEDVYVMQHDIYSLGVCLLEVGLWESFLSYEDNAAAPIPTTALDITLDDPEFRSPALMKEHLIALAKHGLPKRMGDRYMKVVVNCLTCLDQDNTDFGDHREFEDLDGVLVGVRYIEKILLKLDAISV